MATGEGQSGKRRGKYGHSECQQTWTQEDVAWIRHQVEACKLRDQTTATALAEAARALSLQIAGLQARGDLRTDSEQRVLAVAPGKLAAIFARLGTDQDKDDTGGRI